MPTGTVRTSPAVGRLLKERRTALNLSLSEVSRRLAREGAPIPHSTLLRIEQGRLDPGVRRLHHLLRMYEIPPRLVADYVDLEDRSASEPIEGDHETLYDRAVSLWRAGDLRGSLAHLFELRRRLGVGTENRGLRHKANLAFAIAARDLGKFYLAKSLLDDVILDQPDPDVTTRCFVLVASIWEGLGSLDVAFAFLREATSRLKDGDVPTRAFVSHQEAKLLLKARRLRDADRALRRSLAAYRKVGDTYGESRAGLLRVRIHEGAHRIPKAIEVARDLIAFSTSHGHAKLALTAELELGRLIATHRVAEQAIPHLRGALGQAVLLDDRNARLLAHHHLWKAYRQSGDQKQAQIELDAAKSLVRFVDDLSAEAEEIRELSTRGRKGDA